MYIYFYIYIYTYISLAEKMIICEMPSKFTPDDFFCNVYIYIQSYIYIYMYI